MGAKDQLMRRVRVSAGVLVSVVALMAACSAAAPGKPRTGFFRLPASVLNGPQRLMMVGDSTTQAGSCGDGDRYALGEWLTKVAGKSVQFVGSVTVGCHQPYNHCECYPGRDIPYMINGVESWLANAQPSIVILRVGINDLGDWGGGGNRTAQQALSDMVTLVAKIRALSSNVRIVVDELFETNGSVSAALARASVKARQFNQGLGKALEPFGDYVRIGRTSELTTRWLVDGLHPSDTGLVGVAQFNYEALAPWLSDQPLPRTDSVLDFVP